MASDRSFGVKTMVLFVILLLVVYEVVIVTRIRTITLSIVNVPEVYNETITNSSLVDELKISPAGHIWPREGDETNDRITDQLLLATGLNWLGKSNVTNLKLIYQVPHNNYGDPTPEGQHLFTSQQCHIQACSITRQQKDLQDADAVFLERLDETILKGLLPKSKDQVWILFGREPPPLSTEIRLFDSRAVGNLVNWTMFYRRDATISYPYGKFVTFQNFTRIEDYRLDDGVNFAAGKTKNVAWLVSNCNFGINSGRADYAEELAKYIGIDTYGRCGKLKCPKEEWQQCLQMLKRDYKFYLAFENNCCREYITEKFFRNALLNNAIPIVLGAHPDDYKSMAPPGSYIHVDDFESPKELADYLNLLDKNDTLYNEYFRWKKTGSFIATSPWCRLCALLHANDDGSYVHWYPDFHKWWEDGACLEKARPGQWQSWRNKIRS